MNWVDAIIARIGRAFHAEQILLARRQAVFELWKYMTAARDIDPKKPIYPAMLQVVNTLELVAVCWDGEIVDRAIIRRTFGTRFVELYQAVDQVPAAAPWKAGREFLRGSPATERLYDELRRAQ
jgi:hypothetical protein